MRSDDDSIVLSLSMWFFHVKMDKIVKAPDEVATVEVAGMLTGIFATAWKSLAVYMHWLLF